MNSHDEERRSGQLIAFANDLSATLPLYLAATPNLFYAAAVLFHVGLGVVFCVAGLLLLREMLRGPVILKLGSLILAVGSVLGLALIYTGTAHRHWGLAYAHIASVHITPLRRLLPWRCWLLEPACQTPSSQRGGEWQPQGLVAVAIIDLNLGAFYARGWWSKRFIIQNPRYRAHLPMDMKKATERKGHSFPALRRSQVLATSLANTSWSPTPASVAIRTFITNGRVRRITFLRSITSGIARVSSTCRTSKARTRRACAASVTIRP